MWNGSIHAAMVVAALSAALAGPASAGYRNNGCGGAYGRGGPAATYDAAGHGLSRTYGYGGSDRAVAYGGGLENGRSSSAAAAAPVPERTRLIVRRRGPKRLE